MMVYGHPSTAAEGALFLQNFLASVKHPPDEAGQLPSGSSSSSSSVGGGIVAGTSGGSNGGSGSGFLYNLLTAQDATAVQQRSAFLGGQQELPRRSNSMSVRRGSCQLPIAQPTSTMRPSSVPRGHKAQSPAVAARTPPSVSPTTTFSSEEPLDLSTMRMAHEPISDADSEPEQPMLRNILSQLAQHPDEQSVQLAKKNVMVAQSRVSDWLRKGSDLIQTNSTLFGSLEKGIQVHLLCRAWPRILQLYMLENSFHFAVSPAHGIEAPAKTVGRLPTRRFADDLQRLISAASAIPFDNMTYNLLRLAAIFKADPVHEMHLNEVQEEIMKHVLRHLEMKGLGQHFKEAVALLQAVSDTDKEMLENLFCRHLLQTSVDDFIKSKLGF